MKVRHLTKTQSHKPDLLLLAATVVLVLFGLLMIYNSSPVTSERDFGDPTRLARLQIIWAAGGAVLAFIVYKFSYKFWEKLGPLIMVFAIGLLLAVFIPGIGLKIYGAQRWIGVGDLFSIQPAEFVKLAYIIYLAAFLTKKVRFWPFVTLTALLITVLIFQRDLGTAAVVSLTGLLVYFLSGAPILHFLLLVPAGLIAGLAFIFSSDYRRERLLSFINPNADPTGAAYHINQILIALGSGGWFGVGLGQSRQKYGYIPEVTTDSIFAVIGNELGFIGSLIFISLLFFIVFRAFKIASRTPDRFGQLLACGIGIWIGLQVFINLAGMVSLLPLTGIPLPLISYGGSSLLAVFFAVAILLNLSKNTSKEASV
ncbi:MAG TPA: putative lipid II flippase FtsW [Candidatus Nanoarchaeia archaeon]|nr:putative peptidoglycan glycosyltransferase FtsW [uncultured archaeon]